MNTEPNWGELSEKQKYFTTRARNLKQLYGINIELFESLENKQGGLCAICGNPPRDKWGRSDGLSLSVDMNTDTGEVRGLLCRSCKTAVTLIKEDALIASKMSHYLTK
jgi:hypothetical protein